ncbi:MAG: sigma-54-dependent Fis family transcriptional regulator, partial [Planctomycetaceae bacterium]|nr:sigma-54-dependent Fis family transcriptional regulator [Planctomycetaceae bacterium]
GSLFLDEIGDMPAPVQTRLLRVLQEGIVQPVGTDDCVPVDVRIISATHQPLEQSIADKLFRQDLYFRLKGIELSIPPLRTRHDDIVLLAHEFLATADTTEEDVAKKSLSSEAVSAILQHTWPGNVRELQQMISAAVALADSQVLRPEHLGLVVRRPAAAGTNLGFDRYLDLPLTEARAQLIEDFERLAIERALAAEHGNVSAAGRRLQIHRQNLQQKIKQLGIR